MNLRPAVLAFAQAMEATLTRHDAEKPDWATQEHDELRGFLNEEYAELTDELDCRPMVPDRVQAESVDLGIMAMMFHDRNALVPSTDRGRQ